MSHRPLVLVAGLTLGDYLLWNWSLSANHDVLALVSGLTLPPLALACMWLLALSVARLLARSTRRARRAAGPPRAALRERPGRHSGAGASRRGDPGAGELRGRVLRQARRLSAAPRL